MHKALIPMVVSLALCGAAATALVISSARAEPGPHKPVMVATAAQDSLQLAANDSADGPPPPPRMPGRNLNNAGAPPADRAARLDRMCRDMFARQTGELAYTEARLNLTPAQRPLFQRWKDTKLSIAQRREETCTKELPQRAAARDNRDARPGPGERMAREETMLKQRLTDIEAERPAIDALYNALSPEQRMELAGPRNRMGGMMRPAMFRQPMGPRDPGFMSDGPTPPPGPDAMPGPMPPR